MKIYYSRTVDTNDGINGSALQKFLEKSGLFGKAEILRYEKQPVYSFDKLDSADMMIIGYCESRHNGDQEYTVGKGVYSEMERASEMNIPIFLLNLNNFKIPYLEEVNFNIDVRNINVNDYTNFAKIAVFYTAQEIDDLESRMCAYENNSKDQIQEYLVKYGVNLSSLESKSTSQGQTVKYDPVTFQEIETSPSLLLLRRK
jgi:hypothetical protein